jgi:hypothetical protein
MQIPSELLDKLVGAIVPGCPEADVAEALKWAYQRGYHDGQQNERDQALAELQDRRDWTTLDPVCVACGCSVPQTVAARYTPEGLFHKVCHQSLVERMLEKP